MTDKKLTDNEIKKALECCCNAQCSKCKYYGTGNANCVKTNMINSFDLINRLQAQNKDLAETVHNLTIEKDALFDKAEELKAEIERLKTNLNVELENFATEYDNKIKAEAIKEFAEKLKDVSEHFWEEKENFVSEEQIDNLLKELAGEEK